VNEHLLRDGDYARKQIYCPSGVVRWSHGSRFDLARRLVAARAGGRLLDYGCGDGTFLAMIHGDFAEARGWDVDPGQIAECRKRLGHLPGVAFEAVPDGGRTPPDAGSWDVVTCMEVLEHCVEPERRRVLDVLHALVRPGGLVVISVPIEIGPSVAGKQLFRALAGMRNLGDYRHRERYSAAEMLRSIAGLPVTRVAFDGQSSSGPYRYYGHKGFDYRDLARDIDERFTVRERRFSPMPWLGAALNSQVWFVATRR
jgi:2-polyprenyl-3-methyl-5-hydroxy-6-metoxy-1,4-benzoquinol methylase